MSDSHDTQKAATLADSLPALSVRAHPFGSSVRRDIHKEYFDKRTNFYNGLLSVVPVSYYHNWDPNTGIPKGDPVAIGTAKNARVKEDGRWDDIEFFSDIPLDIKERLQLALEKRTLRTSPTVVPDFHSVERDGHIKNWLTGSIAVFDAEGRRQPANPYAIALPQMKSLFKAAHLDFPDLTEIEQQGDTMAETNPIKIIKQWRDEIDTWLKAAPVPNVKPESKEDQAAWDELFGGDTTDGANPSQEEVMATDLDALRIEYDNKMKAADTRTSQLENELKAERISLATERLNSWFDAQLTAGKVLPAERDLVVGTALGLQGANVTHPTMKAASGANVSLLDAFKQTIEQRKPLQGLEGLDINTLKAQGFNQETNTENTPPTAERTAKLLGMTPLGEQVIKSKNGNH